MLTELRELFAYNHWANDRLLGVCAPLSAEQVNRQLGGSFPSIWETLTHVYGAENSWLARWEGTPAGQLLDLGSVNDVPGLADRWAGLWGRQSRLIAALTDADVRRPMPIVFRSGLSFEQQIGATMRHCVNHSTYHRGQITNFLRMLDVKPVPLDLVLYYMEYPPAQ